ncbi:hypothetical protein MCUN1_001338 [Malassezia cuniculi]|uniref:2-dehydropantoate 2-reductase n=1 Tax=Malassezia cuniculi TaxID=948313 RepID=A0AAF0J5G9_9BASI|nr:hypothetical protein MCUN1_001338 [Malassezia cuniculi]
MHAHVIGVGAVGTLIASHMRRVLAAPRTRGLRELIPESTLTLHLRERPFAKQPLAAPGRRLIVERDGALSVQDGFRIELMTAAGAPRALQPDSRGELHDVAAPAEPIDSIIVATKADATYSALSHLVERITPATTVVLLQNGMGVLDMLCERLFYDPDKRPHMVLASTTHGCFTKRPLHTVHAGFGSIHLAVVPNPRNNAVHDALSVTAVPDTPELHTLRGTLALLLSLPLDVHWEKVREFQLRALRKLVINACVNPATALVDCKNGELYGAAPAAELFRLVCTEASQVLEAHARDAKASDSNSEDASRLTSLPLADLLTQTDSEGMPLLDASLRPASLQHEVERVVRATAGNWSSMHQDIRTGRVSTEIDYINGYLCDLGRTYGIPTPANDMLTHLVKLKSRRVTGSWNGSSM